MSRKIEDLAADVQLKARAFLDALTFKGIPYFVASTLRTEAEQIALYSQGRDALLTVNQLRSAAGMPPIAPTDNTYTVTNADGIRYKSNHQGGRALDVVPINDQGNPIWPPFSDPRWQLISAEGKAQGFSWGGDWPRFPDNPHYEMV